MEQLQTKIQNWLNNPSDYYEGISLLNQVCSNKTLIRNLSRKDSFYNREKLCTELKKFASPTTTPPSNTSAASVSGTTLVTENRKIVSDFKTTIPTPSIVVFPTTPEETKAAVEKLELALSSMHNKKGILSNSLRDFAPTDNAGRKKVLEKIDGLNQDMNDIRSKLVFYNKNGTLPPLDNPPTFTITEKEIPDDPVGMKQMLLNERSNSSKIKRKLDDPNTDKNKISELEARYASKNNLIAEIERRLNGSN